MQPSGTFTPLLKATFSLPSAIVQHDMSSKIGEPSFDGHAGGDRIGRQPAIDAAERRHQNAGAAGVDEVQRHLAGPGRQQRPIADAPQVARRCAARSTATPCLRRFFDAQLAWPARRCVWPKPYWPSTTAIASFSKTILIVLVGQHLAGAEPVDVVRDANHAVRVVADQVGFGQIVADALGFVGVAAGGGENGAGQSFQSIVCDFHGVPWVLTRTNFCSVWQSGETRPRLPPADIVTSPTYTSPKRSTHTSCGAKKSPAAQGLSPPPQRACNSPRD